MLGFCPLASGSKGNSLYLGTEKCKVLFDCGLSGKATKERLLKIGVDVADIDAIVITHEHGDHIKGLRILAFKLGIPVYANTETAKGIVEFYRDCPKFKIFTNNEAFEIEDLVITPFSISHDCADPVAFTVHVNEHKLGICTDLGYASTQVQAHLNACHMLYLEANHDPDMVLQSARPHFYKQRVLGNGGHLSNQQAGELLREVLSPKLQRVYLAHLSEDCNSHDRALETVKRYAGEAAQHVDFHIALQKEISSHWDFYSEAKLQSSH